MICPKCGTQNPNGSGVCNSCGFSMSGYSPATQTYSIAGISGWAIISLLCGILTPLTFGISGILAVIFGIIALIEINKSNKILKGKVIAITGIILPFILSPIFLIEIFITSQNNPEAQKKLCKSNMESLYKSFLSYAQENNGKYPTCEKWCDLLIEYAGVSKKRFICKGASKGPCNYAMNKNIGNLGANAPPNMVLLFETSPGWNQSGGPKILSKENHSGAGCNILLNNGIVLFFQLNDPNDYEIFFLLWK